jgi:hypothetical protein
VDCGVFVCRYAYNLYIMRHKAFSHSQVKNSFQDLITDSPAFKFGMKDIARIREEFISLVDALGQLYIEFKTKEEAKQEDDND